MSKGEMLAKMLVIATNAHAGQFDKICEDYGADILKFSQFGANAAMDCAAQLKNITELNDDCLHYCHYSLLFVGLLICNNNQ